MTWNLIQHTTEYDLIFILMQENLLEYVTTKFAKMVN